MLRWFLSSAKILFDLIMENGKDEHCYSRRSISIQSQVIGEN